MKNLTSNWRTLVRSVPSILLTLALTSLAHAQDAAPEVDATATAEDSLNLWSLIQQGGWAMYPLGTCSLIMFFLIFYSWKETAPKKFFTTDQLSATGNSLNSGDIEQGRKHLEESGNLLARALSPALKKIKKGREKAENLFIENLEAEENGVSQWVTYLNVVASVAPMIGLLGTVSGMISAFQTIGRGGMGRPELLAGDIGEALITTATGLVIGIPAMIAYFILRNRLNSAMIATAQAGTDLIETADEAGESH
ncbi:MAG: biopolymer transport protein ExbB [Lentimonas sp.]|jgi:biopolymer transport protein ExbB